MIVGEILSDTNGNVDVSTPAFNDWYGIQALKWNDNNPFFQLAFRATGGFATNNVIAGWSFDREKFENADATFQIHKTGYLKRGTDWKISASGDTTDPGGFISSSAFKVSSDGRMTASAANIEGKITSTEGAIGGFVIESNEIRSSNNNLRLKSNGEITGSEVLFTGGKLGGFTIASHELSAPNFSVSSQQKRVSAGFGDNIVILDGDLGISCGSASFDDAPFKISRNGFVTATNFSERIQVVNSGNSGSFIRHTNAASSSGDLVFDGSRGGGAIMNMVLAISSSFQIKDVILPSTASNNNEVNIVLHADATNITFDTDDIFSNQQIFMQTVENAYRDALVDDDE